MPTVDLAIGPIEYRIFGPDDPGAPTAVFVHGFLVNGTLWDGVAERLAGLGIRSIVPDWPLGSHRLAVPADRELSPTAVGRAVLELIATLDLNDVVLVGNDTGGGICQLALAGDHHRIAGLVLTNCDAFEAFPPKYFVPLFLLARHRPAVWWVMQTTRLAVLRHSPLAFGPLLLRPRSARLTKGWVRPALEDLAIRHDIARFARGMTRRELTGAAAWLSTFDKPARLVWGARDRHFNIRLARRLAEALPDAQLIEVPGARTFVSVDRPEPVVAAVMDLVRKRGTSF